MVFCSNDQLHKTMAPLVLRGDQRFVTGCQLKADLARLADWHDCLTDPESRYQAVLGEYPPPLQNSIAYQLWTALVTPWSPEYENLAAGLTEDDRRSALDWVAAIMRDAEG